MKRPTYTPQQIADAVTEAKGLISIAARRVGCDPATIRNYAKKYKIVADALHEAKESLKDFAESRLYKGIDEGNPTLLIFYLKTQAKDRGYVERQEMTGAGGGAIRTEDVGLTDEQRLEKIAAIFDAARARRGGSPDSDE